MANITGTPRANRRAIAALTCRHSEIRSHARFVLLATAMFAPVILSTSAIAQTVPAQLPGSVEPGRRETAPPELPKPPVSLEWEIELPAGPEPPKSIANEKFKLQDLKINGVTVYSRDDLKDLFQEFIGKEITVAQFYGIARAIQGRYRADGYLLSFAYVPPQEVADGVFKVTIVEGFVEKVLIRNVDGALKETLERLLAPIAEARPLRGQVLERYMLLGNDLSGVKISSVLQPAKTTRGASELVVTAHHKPVDAQVSIDNRGSEFTGPWEGSATVGLNSLLGQGERLSVRGTTTANPRELKAVDLTYSHPIGSEGLLAGGTLSHSRARPGFTLQSLEVQTETTSAQISANYPVIRSREHTLRISGGLGLLNSKVDVLKAPFSRDRLRTARAGVSYNQAGFLGGGSGVSGTVIQGLPILAATEPDKETTSRADADNAYTKFTGEIVHRQPLIERLSALVSISGQYSRTSLPAAEEFSLGGARFGRAYNVGEFTGEHGVAASAEISYNVEIQNTVVNSLIPYIFFDAGKVWDKSSASSQGLSRSLSSAGTGVRVGLPFGANLRFEYAKPVTHRPSNKGDKVGRFFMFLSAQF